MIRNSTVITIRTFIIAEPFSVASRGLRRDGEGFTTSGVDWSDYIVRYLQGLLCTSFNVMIKVSPIERRFIESFLAENSKLPDITMLPPLKRQQTSTTVHMTAKCQSICPLAGALEI